jgi:hypothetical protein
MSLQPIHSSNAQNEHERFLPFYDKILTLVPGYRRQADFQRPFNYLPLREEIGTE